MGMGVGVGAGVGVGVDAEVPGLYTGAGVGVGVGVGAGVGVGVGEAVGLGDGDAAGVVFMLLSGPEVSSRITASARAIKTTFFIITLSRGHRPHSWMWSIRLSIRPRSRKGSAKSCLLSSALWRIQ